VENLRQVSRTPKRVRAAAWNSSFENGADRKGAFSPNEFEKRSLAEITEAMRRWSAGGVIGASLEALGAEDLDLIEGLLLDLAGTIADALVRPVEDCTQSFFYSPVGAILGQLSTRHEQRPLAAHMGVGGAGLRAA